MGVQGNTYPLYSLARRPEAVIHAAIADVFTRPENHVFAVVHLLDTAVGE